MTQIGIVQQIEDRMATVRVIRKGACGDNCSMCGACGTGHVDVKAACDLRVSVGDRVRLESSDAAVIGGLICIFILPVLLPIVIYVLFSSMINATAGWIAAAIVFGMSVSSIILLNKNQGYLLKVQPRVVAILEE